MPIPFSPEWLTEHPEEYERLLAQRLIAPTPPEAWRAQFAACAGYLSKGAPKGAGDSTHHHHPRHRRPDRPYENASHTALRIPNARLVTLHGAGHLCWIEDAPVVNDLIANAVTTGEPAP
jgi:hypothetical protein